MLISFHGDEAIKAKYLARVRAHAAADQIIQGTGWEDGRGCAIGCTLDAYDHRRYPIELGIPLELARLEDRIFEGISADKAKKWPLEFLSAIPVGADLSGVWPRFAIWLLKDVRKLARPDGQAAIDTVIGLYREQTPQSDQRWLRARSAAYDAADYDAADSAAADSAAAAYTAADSAYAAAAYTAAAAVAAYAYAAAAAVAAYAYAAAAAAAAAAVASVDSAAVAAYAYADSRSGHYYRQSRRLLDILRTTKVAS